MKIEPKNKDQMVKEADENLNVMKTQIINAVVEVPIIDVVKEVSETELVLSVGDATFNVTIEEDCGYYTLFIESSDGFDIEWNCVGFYEFGIYNFFDKFRLLGIINEYIKWLQK